MKTASKIATLILMVFVVSGLVFSQELERQKPDTHKPATATQNLVRGVFGPMGANDNWAGYSVWNVIPGSALFAITSTTTVFYFGFAEGSESDISNMVLYTTPRGSLTISAITPVTLGGVSNPSIDLASTAVCPVQPLSTTNPCTVRFDPTTITLSPASDYYLMVYFTNDTNNSSMGGIQPTSSQSSLGACYTPGDESHLTAGQSVPRQSCAPPIFLMYVMNN